MGPSSAATSRPPKAMGRPSGARMGTIRRLRKKSMQPSPLFRFVTRPALRPHSSIPFFWRRSASRLHSAGAQPRPKPWATSSVTPRVAR
ncbi:hypothetical protein COSO111634_37745 [Corallococcus soli]